ncbi:MAG: ArnT family glycosyltransferase [bacterium]
MTRQPEPTGFSFKDASLPPTLKSSSLLIFVVPAIVGLLLMIPVILKNSATYDEVAYARIACEWYRGEPTSEITRMGSPVSFWKVQSLPGLLLLDALGRDELIQDPLKNLPRLLVWLRFSALWCWLVAIGATQGWALWQSGRKAAWLCGFLFALGPNFMAHASLITMEMPLTAFWTLALLSFQAYTKNRRFSFLVASGIFAGMAFSMKFTGFLLPFLMAAFVFFDCLLKKQKLLGSLLESLTIVVLCGSLLIATNLVMTGFDTIRLSEQSGRHPWLENRFPPGLAAFLSQVLETNFPVDWVGFITQMRHQSSGGPSYLLGKISSQGWWYYYPVTIAVKVPLVILLLMVIRVLKTFYRASAGLELIPFVCLVFLVLACAGSKRNYGFRYLLPLAPMMMVWFSSLFDGKRRAVWGLLAVVALAIETSATYPYPLVFFNRMAGGTNGGRLILADSNLDWGQGLISLREIQKDMPELNDLTLYYFGDADPTAYGIRGTTFKIDASDNFDQLPEKPENTETQFVGISTSLLNGPWGPPGYFREMMWHKPLHTTSDWSIQIFRVSKMDHH